MNICFLDTETQSTIDLREVGSKKYIADDTTRMMSLVTKVGNDVIVWIPKHVAPPFVSTLTPKDFTHEWITPDLNIRIYYCESTPFEILNYFCNGYTFCAHNATFDKEVIKRFVCSTTVPWIDTVPRARAGGYPGKLGELSKYLFGVDKDEGSAAMKLLTKVKVSKGKIAYPVGTIPVWRSMLQYNIVDVLQLEKIYDKVKDFGDAETIRVDEAINTRGIYVDKQLVRQMLALYNHNEIVSQEKLDQVAGGVNIRSHQQVKAWLKDKGYVVESLNKQALEQFFADPLTYGEGDSEELDANVECVIEMLRLRQNVIRAGQGKIERMWTLANNEDDRIRDQFVYHGTHPGRFSGRQLQPHNFPKGSDRVNAEPVVADLKNTALTYEKLLTYSAEFHVSPSEILSTVTRSCLSAAPGYELAIVDYAQIQCRIIAWIADELGMMAAFRRGDDLYKEMAAVIFGIDKLEVTKEQRQLGKITVLGCGFGMSAGKFDATCRIQHNVNLEAAGTDAKQCVDGYRKQWVNISGGLNGPRTRHGLWQKLHDTAHRVISNGDTETVARCKFEFNSGSFILYLPSGRPIYYRNARIEDRIPGYCKTLGIELRYVPTIVYDHPHGYEGILYGGLITENICMGIEADFLSDALVKLERADLRPIIHVHDEIVCEVEDAKRDLHEMSRIMSIPPDWAEGFPLRVEGFSNVHYSKKAFSTSYKTDYLLGEEYKK